MKKSMFKVEKKGDIQQILFYVIDIFDQELSNPSKEECFVFNDPNAESPMLIINQEMLKIRLKVKDESDWKLLIYQISHELMHYSIRQVKDDKDNTVKWFEETICEAFSLYILSIAMSNWRTCSLYKKNKQYIRNIASLYNNICNNSGDKISKCKTLECLKEVDLYAEEHREWRYDIRNKVLELFKDYRRRTKDILNYSKYIEDNKLTIDFDNWENESQHPEFINELARIQPEVS